MGIDCIRINVTGDKGVMEYTNKEGQNTIRFGMEYNEFGAFSGKRRMSIVASKYEEGNYACGASTIWCEKAKLPYFGTLSITLGYKDDRVSVTVARWAQRILHEYGGCAVGYVCS